MPIYSEQKCSTCGSNLKYLPTENTLTCEFHPYEFPTSCRVYYKGFTKRFKGDNCFKDALAYETHLKELAKTGQLEKVKVQQRHTFDKVANEWLLTRRSELSNDSWRRYKQMVHLAVDFFKDKHLNTFILKDFADFVSSLQHSSRSKHMTLKKVKAVFQWAVDNNYIDKLPTFPKLSFKCKRTQPISKDTQTAVFQEVFKMCRGNRDKLWLGIYFLCSHFKLRPYDLLRVKEKDIDLSNKVIYLHSKTGETVLNLSESDIQLLQGFVSPQDGDKLFFRYDSPYMGASKDTPYGRRLFYKIWKEAHPGSNGSRCGAGKKAQRRASEGIQRAIAENPPMGLRPVWPGIHRCQSPPADGASQGPQP
jgi:integrase